MQILFVLNEDEGQTIGGTKNLLKCILKNLVSIKKLLFARKYSDSRDLFTSLLQSLTSFITQTKVNVEKKHLSSKLKNSPKFYKNKQV